MRLEQQLALIRKRPHCKHCGLVNPAEESEWTQEHPSCVSLYRKHLDKLKALKETRVPRANAGGPEGDVPA